EDLLTAMGDETSDIDELDPYFLGSIVLAKEEHKPEAEVIDGQQRLATLVILLSVIRSLSTDEDYARAIEQRLYEPADAIMGTPNRYRLTLRPQDQDFFRRYIQDRGGLDELAKKDPATLTDSQRNIRANEFGSINARYPQGRSGRGHRSFRSRRICAPVGRCGRTPRSRRIRASFRTY
ncbi:MAG: DUF262 domain-containing protein, partial [Clostridia bacterium]|nr:DUF262 domain-containing protein [Clostridia bacterium]